MSYLQQERNDAIKRIGEGNAQIADAALYNQLAQFNWIYIIQKDGKSTAELTYSGKDLFKRILKG